MVFGCSQNKSETVTPDSTGTTQLEVFRVTFVRTEKPETMDQKKDFPNQKFFLEIGEYWSKLTLDSGGHSNVITFKTENLISYEQIIYK